MYKFLLFNQLFSNSNLFYIFRTSVLETAHYIFNKRLNELTTSKLRKINQNAMKFMSDFKKSNTDYYKNMVRKFDVS